MVQVTPPGQEPAVAPGATPEPPSPTPAAAPKTSKARRRIPLAFVGVDERGIRPGVPAVEMVPLYTNAEIARYGLKQGTEVRVPVVRGTF